MRSIISYDDLVSNVSYNYETGEFTWISSKRGPINAGDIAGTIAHNGYRVIKINGKLYLAHRLAFLYVNKQLPLRQIDHINGIKSDNRWINLRECSDAENKWNTTKFVNNTTGYKGVSLDRRRGTYSFLIMSNGQSKRGSGFNTAKDAADAYRQAEIEMRGFIRSSGRDAA